MRVARETKDRFRCSEMDVGAMGWMSAQGEYSAATQNQPMRDSQSMFGDDANERIDGANGYLTMTMVRRCNGCCGE